jgi:hypothetical protein
MPALWNMAVGSGDNSRPTPAVRAAPLAPRSTAPEAKCVATRDEEHAVSTLAACPLKANT